MRPAPKLSYETKKPCIKLNLFAKLSEKLDFSKSLKPRGPRFEIASQRSTKS